MSATEAGWQATKTKQTKRRRPANRRQRESGNKRGAVILQSHKTLFLLSCSPHVHFSFCEWMWWFFFWGRSSRWFVDKRASDCLCETEKAKAQQRPINKAAAGERMWESEQQSSHRTKTKSRRVHARLKSRKREKKLTASETLELN